MKPEIHDKDLQGVEKALRRARTRAKKIAEQTDTPLVIFKDGQIIKKKVGKNQKTTTS